MKNLLMSTIISCMGYTNDMLSDVPPQLQWSVLHSLPVANGHTKQAGLAGPIVGVSQNVLMIAGGANFEDALPWEGGKRSISMTFMYYTKILTRHFSGILKLFDCLKKWLIQPPFSLHKG
jgi:hypothetical protein